MIFSPEQNIKKTLDNINNKLALIDKMKLNEMKQKIETKDNKMEEKIDNKITKKMETIDNAMEGRIYNKIAIKLDNNEKAKIKAIKKNNEKEIKLK